jgi:hypothetical protein
LRNNYIAGQGRVAAQKNLAYFYFHGQFVPKDITKSIRFLEMAAKQGDLESQYQLGLCYRDNISDIENATKLFRQAAENGSAAAQDVLGFQYLTGKGV